MVLRTPSHVSLVDLIWFGYEIPGLTCRAGTPYEQRTRTSVAGAGRVHEQPPSSLLQTERTRCLELRQRTWCLKILLVTCTVSGSNNRERARRWAGKKNNAYEGGKSSKLKEKKKVSVSMQPHTMTQSNQTNDSHFTLLCCFVSQLVNNIFLSH